MAISYVLFKMKIRGIKWPPNSPEVYNGIKGIIELWYDKSLNRRITGMANLLRIIPRWFRED